MAPEIMRCLQQIEAGFRLLDPDILAQQHQFPLPFYVKSDAEWVIFQNRARLAGFMGGVFDALRAAGLTHCRARILDFTAEGPRGASAVVSWAHYGGPDGLGLETCVRQYFQIAGGRARVTMLEILWEDRPVDMTGAGADPALVGELAQIPPLPRQDGWTLGPGPSDPPDPSREKESIQ